MTEPLSDNQRLRQRAMYRVHRAVKAGELPDLSDGNTPCDDCGEPATCYDHRNYNHPLAVDPVCKGCNNRRGPGFPYLTEDDTTNLRHSLTGYSGQGWNGVQPKGKRREGMASADTGGVSFGLPGTEVFIFREMGDDGRDFHIQLAFDELHGRPMIRSGHFRSLFFKRHDPFFVAE